VNRRATFGLAGLLLTLLAAAAPVAAAEHEVKLRITPLGAEGTFFELELEPGERHRLEVELANLGEGDISVRTYAADVYSLINGGFGAELRDEPASGTTLWLDYQTEVFDLPAGEGLERSFSVSVPRDAGPGQYVTSIVLENDQPLRGSGPVALDQVIRQAVAVALTVPGPQAPALQVGSARHSIVAERSTVAVEVRNPGNVHLKPKGTISLRDAAGTIVSQAPVAMDSVYAGTDTLVEVPLAELLGPGDYSVDLELEDDATGARASGAGLPLQVLPPVSSGVDQPGPGSVLVPVTQVLQELPPTLVGAIALGLLGGLLLGLVVLGLDRRRARQP
jgi:hypothetical protein